jgi:hypothetical protein
MHKVVLLFWSFSADDGGCKVGNGVEGLHRDVSGDKIFHQSLVQGFDILAKVVKSDYMPVF